MTLTLISLAIFLAYLGWAIGKVRLVPPSLSETFYLIGNEPTCYLFTATLWAMGFTLLPALMDCTPDGWRWSAFLAIAGICFVGAAPLFKEQGQRTVHVAAALCAAVFGLLWCVGTLQWWSLLTVGLSVAGGFYGAFRTNGWRTSATFWLEMMAFGSVYLSAILRYILL